MKRLTLMLASLALASCGVTTTEAPPAPASGIVAQADTVVLSGKRGFAAAELAYISASQAVGLAVDTGVIKGATAIRVRGYNAEARKLLIAGKATTDGAEKALAAAKLFGVTDRLNAIIGSN